MAEINKSNMLIYQGCNFFRQRIILATLSGKSVKITNIRHMEDNPGIAGFEVDLMKLIEKLSKGATIKFTESSTTLIYHPGILDGGKFDHDCHLDRPIGYYLQVIICLAPFMKRPIDVTLRGITNNKDDPSIDSIQYATLPVLKRFLGIDEGLNLKINKRGAATEGGGEVHFTCPTRQKLRPIQFTNPGKIKRIRGIAWATRVSPADCRRMTDAAREILCKCLSDVYITSDHRKGPSSGKSPGFGITLVAETKNDVFLCAEASSNPKGSENGPSLPEDVGTEAGIKLLMEIFKGGCVDSDNQFLACALMVLGDKDISKLQMGPLSDYTINFLRHLRDFFGVTFKVDVQPPSGESNGGDKFLLTCVGVGYKNISKPTV